MPHRKEQRRQQAVARYHADDKIEDICKAMGGSKSWLYKWRDRYQADDPNWAKELTRRPRTTPAKTPQTIEQAVVSLRRALCQNGQGCGAAAIKQGLEQHGLEPVLSQRTIYRILQRHQKEVT
jgi:transposase-like protein